MAKFYPLNDLEPITLKELVSILEGKGEFAFDDEQLIVDLLSRVYKNRNFLTEVLLNQISSTKSFQDNNPYTSQAFILHSSQYFAIRATIWSPVERVKDGKEDIFFYDIPHDHNFSFYTLGYKGCGYTTRLYEYERPDRFIDVGEKFEVRKLGDKVLSEGEIWFYEAAKDIHTQIPPEELSISINIIDNRYTSEQFYFDPEEGVVTGRTDNKYEPLYKLAKMIGNNVTNDLVNKVITNAKKERTRNIWKKMISKNTV